MVAIATRVLATYGSKGVVVEKDPSGKFGVLYPSGKTPSNNMLSLDMPDGSDLLIAPFAPVPSSSASTPTPTAQHEPALSSESEAIMRARHSVSAATPLTLLDTTMFCFLQKETNPVDGETIIIGWAIPPTSGPRTLEPMMEQMGVIRHDCTVWLGEWDFHVDQWHSAFRSGMEFMDPSDRDARIEQFESHLQKGASPRNH